MVVTDSGSSCRSGDDGFPDGRIEVSSIKSGEGFAVVEFIGRGTNSGSLKTPAGELPPTNRSVELRFCDVIEVSDGRISGGRTYWDMASLMTQLGVMPEPPSAAGSGLMEVSDPVE